MIDAFDGARAAAALDELFAEGVDGARVRERTEFDCAIQAHSGRLVLFGAGNLGRRALARLRADGITPLAFSDNERARWGQIIDGLPVLSPNDAAREFGASALFLVTIWNDQQRFAETAGRLAQLGCRHVAASPPLRWKYQAEIPDFPFFFLDLPSKVYNSVSDVVRASQLWEDDRSRREFVAQIRLRLFGDLLGLPGPEPNQYAPNGMFVRAPDEVFIDCGAFDGDTVRTFIESWGDRFRSVYALEPDPASYRKLADFVRGLPEPSARRIEVLQVAVGEESGQVRFRADGTMGAAISPDGDVAVACRTLDELFDQEAVTYVKMDIEGEELNALRGSQRLMARCRPVLAVCVYHRLEHLWSIPLYLHRQLQDYAFILRPHKPDGWDLILYAVPRERSTVG